MKKKLLLKLFLQFMNRKLFYAIGNLKRKHIEKTKLRKKSLEWIK